MRVRQLSFSLILLFLLSVFSFQAVAKQLKKVNNIPVYTVDQRVIVVKKSQPTFKIKLESNPTTGYTWFLHEYDVNLVTAVDHTFLKPDTKAMGAPGYEVWTLRVKPEAMSVPHEINIRFNYSRPWQGSQSTTSVAFKIYTQ